MDTICLTIYKSCWISYCLFLTTMQIGNMPSFRSRKVLSPPRNGRSSKLTTKQSCEHCLWLSIQRCALLVLGIVVITVVVFDLSDHDGVDGADAGAGDGAGTRGGGGGGGGSTSTTTANNNDRPLLHFVGERHSGTEWIIQHLTDCFSPQVSVHSGLTRSKHWFQVDGDYSTYQPEDGEADDQERKTVIVAQFRHAYHWVEAMRVNPYYSPEHFDLSWQEFVTRPWTMPRDGQDVNVSLPDGTENICQHNFLPNEVIPCLEIEASMIESPLYEMRNDGSGEPYDSILELRADKIKNFLSTADFDGIQDLFLVQYEQVVRDGTATLIHNLEEALGVKAQCWPTGPQSLSSRPLPLEYVEWMKEHVDWETEALIGYDDHVEWDTEALIGYDDSKEHVNWETIGYGDSTS